MEMWLDHREARQGGPESYQVRLPKMCDETPAGSQSAFNPVFLSVSWEKRAFREGQVREDPRSGSLAPSKGVPLLAKSYASLKGK